MSDDTNLAAVAEALAASMDDDENPMEGGDDFGGGAPGAGLAGEALEILVNDKLVARGEAVVVNEKFGVRLTDIISPQERVQQLG